MPALKGSVTPSVAAAATAASTALPPALSTLRPAALASGSTVLIAPPLPTAVGSLTVGRSDVVDGTDGAGAAGWAGAGVAKRAAATASPLAAETPAVTRRARWGMGVPPESRCPNPAPAPAGCPTPSRVSRSADDRVAPAHEVAVAGHLLEAELDVARQHGSTAADGHRGVLDR